MPFIQKFPKRTNNRNSRKRNKSDKEKLRIKLYNKSAWKKLRSGYLISHPLCEMCLDEDRITPATDVHHVNSPFDEGLTDVERIARLLDVNNLKALCKECHGKLHLDQQRNLFSRN